ncbi:MAG: hypothetical protein WCA20_36820 [Candidatus Sulfotelmatobacter sp.]
MHLLAMMEPSLGPGDSFGQGVTSVHPAILAIMVLSIVLMFVVPRKYVLAPLLLLSILSPMGQFVMVGPFHFQIFRILLVFAWVRLLWERYGSGGQSFGIRISVVDKAVILYTVTSVICYTLLWQRSEAFFDEVGKMYNVLGFYFVFRYFIRDKKDIERTLKVLVVAALMVAAAMFNEQLTGRNVLAVFGGVPEHTAMREGYLRAQGPFTVYLTAGAFGATILPLFLCLWHRGGSRLMAALGIVAALTITITSRTSTAMSACIAAMVGIAMWPLREKMRLVRWSIVVILVGLHLVMKAPVWSLIARVDIVGGSTGWHRFKIVDNFIRHFWDWWLLGSNNYWTWEGGDDMWDAANQYVSTGETSGLLPLIFFLAAVVYCFKYLGKARKAVGNDVRRAWFLWLLGVALFSNLVAFMGISYYDQTCVYWYAVLAMIVAATSLPQRSIAVQLPPAPSASEFSSPSPDLESAQAEPARSGSMLFS